MTEPSSQVRRDVFEPTILSVVVVNYNGWEDTRGVVDTLSLCPEIQGGTAEILVVDNASPIPRPLDFPKDRTGLRLIERGDNGGFSVGVNEGRRHARAPWLLVLNPDVAVEPDFLGRVIDRIRFYAERPEGRPGVVGYALKNPDGTPQPSVGATPGLFRAVWEQLIPRSRRKYQPDWRVRPGMVPWVTGACVLIRAEALDRVGGMDEDFFLYYEEVALCRSIAESGERVEFDPSVSVVHLRPLQNRAISPKMRLVTRHSRLLYFRKHRPYWEFLGLCGLISAEAAVRRRLSRTAEERRAWEAVGRVTRSMRRGRSVFGADVRDLGERLTSGALDDSDWSAIDG